MSFSRRLDVLFRRNDVLFHSKDIHFRSRDVPSHTWEVPMSKRFTCSGSGVCEETLQSLLKETLGDHILIKRRPKGDF